MLPVSMPSSHPLAELAERYGLSAEAVQVLQASGARTPEAMRSLLESFPTLLKVAKVDTLSLGYAIESESVGTESARIAAADAKIFSAAPAMMHPAGAAAPKGFLEDAAIDLPPPAGSIDEALAPTGAGPTVSTHVPRCLPWPARDQGARETCVSFAVAALRAQLACAQMGTADDYSEQFLHWAIKVHSADPARTTEPTHIKFGLEALQAQGICLELLCAYNPAPIAGNPSQNGTAHAPTSAAVSAALRNAAAAAHHAFTHRTLTGKAALLHSALAHGGPVAISLPMYRDPISGVDNWQTRVGRLFGYVLDPVPGSRPNGGHAVSVFGFEPDSAEPMGGYFVIRNSWGSAWGSSLPAPGYYGYEPGYGQVSASYVDRYLWEIGHL